MNFPAGKWNVLDFTLSGESPELKKSNGSIQMVSVVLHRALSGVELVRGAGLEPASLAALEPKSRAFANFANRAENLLYYNTECTTFKPLTEKSPF